ncbi:putative 50S ribosomal protein L36 [Hibiscus syriacus]|uniref:50S ribosomal protein L36 n=1 Tax=Hibiscus syriacus TaxID=106335 RepID=A0A6A3BAI2_HIBSY|nr:uncharacterized protein LOC120218978 isoform X1 [Hibiscus syriacus]KAE8713926.1 putative 50S ribosomal protein L36 [Hibiscus syriacus]
MASMLSSQGMVLATAMAVSGTVILLAFRLQKSLDQISLPSQQALRSCISSEGKKKTKKKKVHFAEDVMDPRSDGAEFRKQLKNRVRINNSAASALNSTPKFKKFGGGKDRGIPANRVALYNGILRDRGVQRLAYSY